MNVALSPAQKRFVDQQITSGRYVDGNDVVREAVRRMEAREAAAAARSFVELGAMADGDIVALAFVVMMEAAKSAQEDLKAILAQVKSINRAKQMLRELMGKVQRDLGANAGRRGDAVLDFSHGLGSERAYHRAPVPYPDPDSAGGVRLVPTDLYSARIRRTEDLCGVKEGLTAKLDTLSEMGEMEAIRLQMAMDRRSKFMSTLSNLLEKQADMQSAIIQNIK